MKDNEKFYSDQEFKQKGIFYTFTIYPTLKDSFNKWNGCDMMVWYNNDITKKEAQYILMGLVSGAKCRYAHPKAVLYSIDIDRHQTALSSCQ